MTAHRLVPVAVRLGRLLIAGLLPAAVLLLYLTVFTRAGIWR
jgi:hypothetical protein